MTSAPLKRRRFTIEEYEGMGRAGILHEDEPLELIDGEIVEMAAAGSRHAAGVTRLNLWFTPRLVGRALVRIQDPIRLPPRGEPEPDVVIVRPRPDAYAEQHPSPADILHVIEVADSSLGYDRGTRLRMYARAGIAEVWIVNLAAGR